MRTLLFVGLCATSIAAVTAQVAAPSPALVYDTYAKYGLVGVQSLALMALMTYIMWKDNKQYAMMLSMTATMKEWVRSLDRIADALNNQPCQHPDFGKWLEHKRDLHARQIQAAGDVFKSKDPFQSFPRGETPK